MTEPTKEQVEKWRKECFDLAIKASIDFHEYENHYFKIAYEKGYLAAKKSDFEEIKTLKEQLAEAVRLAKLGINSVNGLLTHNNESWELSAESWLFKTKIFLEKLKKTRMKNEK